MTEFCICVTRSVPQLRVKSIYNKKSHTYRYIAIEPITIQFFPLQVRNKPHEGIMYVHLFLGLLAWLWTVFFLSRVPPASTRSRFIQQADAARATEQQKTTSVRVFGKGNLEEKKESNTKHWNLARDQDHLERVSLQLKDKIVWSAQETLARECWDLLEIDEHEKNQWSRGPQGIPIGREWKVIHVNMR
jgi:hypothetical protein